MIKSIKKAGAVVCAAVALAGGAVALAAPAQAAPRNIQMNLDYACTQQKTGGVLGRAKYSNFNNPYSWYCQTDLPFAPKGGLNLNLYCQQNYGSYAYLIRNDVWGWRCA